MGGRDWPLIGLKIDIKQGKKTPKGQMVPISRAHRGRPGYLDRSLGEFGRLIFIHLQCWEVLPSCRCHRQRRVKILCPKDPDFYAPLALKTAKGQHLPALEVYKNQSPRIGWGCRHGQPGATDAPRITGLTPVRIIDSKV